MFLACNSLSHFKCLYVNCSSFNRAINCLNLCIEITTYGPKEVKLSNIPTQKAK